MKKSVAKILFFFMVLIFLFSSVQPITHAKDPKLMAEIAIAVLNGLGFFASATSGAVVRGDLVRQTHSELIFRPFDDPWFFPGSYSYEYFHGRLEEMPNPFFYFEGLANMQLPLILTDPGAHLEEMANRWNIDITCTENPIQLRAKPVRVSTNKLEKLVKSAGEATNTVMNQEGYFFCRRYFQFFHVEDHWENCPSCNQNPRPNIPPRPDPPFDFNNVTSSFLGFHFTGLPIFSNRYSTVTSSRLRLAHRYLAKRSFVYNNVEYEVIDIRTGANNRRVYADISINGITERHLIIGEHIDNNKGDLRLYGFIATKAGVPHDIQVWISLSFIGSNGQRRHRIAHHIINHMTISEIIPPAPQPALSPQVSLAPVNALGDIEAMMALLLEMVQQLQGTDDYVYAKIPVAVAGDFPSVPVDEFPAFWEELLVHLGGIENLLMTPEQIASTPAETVLDLDKLFGGIAPPDTGTTPGTLAGILQGILNVVRAIQQAASNVISAIVAVPSAIGDLFYPILNPEVPDIYIPSGMDFDFSINLMDYFPFSIPRDFVDIASILLGTMPAEMAGATTHERAVFFHYQELYALSEEYDFAELLSPEAYELIQPMILSNLTTAPRFELNVPLPNFSGDEIVCPGCVMGWCDGLCQSTLVQTAVIDFADPMFETLVAIIRLSIFVMVLIAVIMASTKMLTW